MRMIIERAHPEDAHDAGVFLVGRDGEPGFYTACQATPCSARSSLKRGISMPHVIVVAEVKDVQHWLDSPKREEVFGPLGWRDQDLR